MNTTATSHDRTHISTGSKLRKSILVTGAVALLALPSLATASGDRRGHRVTGTDKHFQSARVASTSTNTIGGVGRCIMPAINPWVSECRF